ncbi:hypothetical protein P7K49_005249 [Saguinus oedipus]|uniref:Uncharacterized protein n=1 Tax=Saguinus oedipus TaxID=9490 RepID=A0ABQ9W9R9_SAGOE|nr:hypothetical protein P7K49_005249 [Saguinus oedipus]
MVRRCFDPQEDIQHHASELVWAPHIFERLHDSSPARDITSPGLTALHHEGPTLHELVLSPTGGKCECGNFAHMAFVRVATTLVLQTPASSYLVQIHMVTQQLINVNTNIVNHPDSWPHDAKKLAGPPRGVAEQTHVWPGTSSHHQKCHLMPPNRSFPKP